jgi:outer membrane protein TolC
MRLGWPTSAIAGGVTSYLEVLDTERQLFDAELNLARTQRDELLAVVLLYRALGGGWMVEEPPPAASREQGGETVVVNDRRGGSR